MIRDLAPPIRSSYAAGPIPPERPLLQIFRASADFLSAIAPVIATYGRPCAGIFTMALHPARLEATGNIVLGAPIAQRSVQGIELDDNQPVDILFEPIVTSRDQVYALVLASAAAVPQQAATVWLSEAEGRIAGHIACFAGGGHRGDAGIQAAVYYCPTVSPKPVPTAILYSPLTQCNLNCIHCISRSTRSDVYKLGTASKLNISRHASPGGIEYLATDYSGDILWADRRNPGELDYVIGLGIPFHIDTNGVCLSATAIGKLGQSQLASVNISLDAATDATFRRIRRGAPPLDQVLENIRALVRARAASGANFAISLGFTLMRSNLAEWPDFLHLSASLGVESVIARHVEAYTEDMAAESLWHDQTGYNRMRRQIVELGDRLGLRLSLPPAFTDAPERSGHRVCGVAWHSAVVLGNGDVAACCVPSLVMGNLNHNTLEEIWNGPRYQALRRTVNTPQAPRQCQACPMLRLTQNGDSYLFHRILDNKGREPAEAPALLSQPHS